MGLEAIQGMAAGMGYRALRAGFLGLRSNAAYYRALSWRQWRLVRTALLRSASSAAWLGTQRLQINFVSEAWQRPWDTQRSAGGRHET